MQTKAKPMMVDERLNLVRSVPNTRPLYFYNETLYCSQYDRIVATRDFGTTFQVVARLPIRSKWRGLGSMHPVFQRIFRLHPFRLRTCDNGSMVLTMPPGVYYRADRQTDFQVFQEAKGSRPVSLEATPNGRWVFGEYPPNPDRSLEICIFVSDDFGANWQVSYRFPAGRVRHIHGTTYDPWLKCFWICTGDRDEESAIWRAAEDFSEVIPVLSGSAMTRVFWIYANADQLVTATDSPSVQNYILVYDKSTGETTRACATENSSFYYGLAGDRLFVSTNAEPPDASTVSSSNNNDIRASHVWAARPPYRTWKAVLGFQTDFWQRLEALPLVPKGLFQYSTVSFPEGANPSDYLVAYASGLEKYGACMLVYDTSHLKL